MADTPYPLGRVKSKPDERNFPLSMFLGATAPTRLQTLLASLRKSNAATPSLKAWAKEATNRIEAMTPIPTPAPIPTPTPDPIPTPTPIPVPTPPPPLPTSVRWLTNAQLDQGKTGHCVGFAWATWGDCNPVADNYTNDDGNKIYYEAKIFDGEPNAENGSTIHSGAKAMASRKRIAAYAWSTDLDEIKTFVLTKGPIVVGTYWTNGMFEPDAGNVIHTTGSIAGGHAYTIEGYNASTGLFVIQNNWGSGWGDRGFAYIDANEWFALFSKNGDGEACAGVELPIAA